MRNTRLRRWGLVVLGAVAFLVLAGTCMSEQTMQTGPEGPKPGDEVFDFCTPGYSYWTPPPDYDPSERPIRISLGTEQNIQWSPDDSRILFYGQVAGHNRFDWPVDLHSVDPDGSWLQNIVPSETAETWDQVEDFSYDNNRFQFWLRQIVDEPDRERVWGDGVPMIYFDISHDSSRIVYSTCAYTEVEKEEVDYFDWRGNHYKIVADISDPRNLEQKEENRSWIYEYEIVVSDIDGRNAKRLTENIRFDNFPAWSPDGAKVVFISNPDTRRDLSVPGRLTTGTSFSRQFRNHTLTIHTLSTGEYKEISLPLNVSAARYPLAWSPDGERIAFVGWSYDADHFDGRIGIWVIRPDGSELARISDAASGPAWSPDGQRIAVAVPADEFDVAFYSFAADGSDSVLVGSNLAAPWGSLFGNPWIGNLNLSWSPDGSALLLKGFGYIVPLDGSPSIGHIASPNDIIDSAWSPDGSKIAMLNIIKFPDMGDIDPKIMVYVMDRNGRNLLALVEAVPPAIERKVRLAQ